MILPGLWFGKGHPVVNTFMKPIAEVLKQLEISGTCNCFFKFLMNIFNFRY